MKTILKYIFLAAVALIVVACQEGLDQISTEEGMGSVSLSISTKEHTRVGDFTPEELRVRIYDEDDRLVRIYTEDDVIPENIALVAGVYTFKVEARDNDHTTKFKGSDVDDDRTKIYYIGEDDVTVIAGGSVTAEVKCNPQHVRVGVILDEDEGENQYLRNVGISLAAMQLTSDNNPTAVDNKKKNDFDTAYAGADRLDFGTAISGSTTSYVGEDYAYFLMPEGVETIAWVIAGEHVAPAEDQPATTAEEDSTEGSDSTGSNDGATAPEGVVTKFDRAGQIVVEPGKAYALQFRYSKLPDGSITVDVEVDDTVETYDDPIIFKPEPEIKPMSGNTWIEDEDNDNVYVVGTSDISFNVTSINKLDGFGLDEEKLWDKGNYVSDEAKKMITVAPVGNEGKEFTVTVNPAYFATLAGGTQTFWFSAYDGATEVGKFKTKFLNQGLTKPTDIDLWLNTAKFNAVVTQTATNVAVKFRKVKGTGSYGDWVTVGLSNTTGNVYGGTSVAAWSDAITNTKGMTVYKPNPDKSIFANGTYEYQLVVDGSDYGPSGTFTTTVEQPIPNADFESSSLSCWGQSNSNATFWGSGNNWAKTNLCTQGSKDGNGGSKAAVLTSSATAGVLASGNLFTGTFTMNGMAGTVGFGQPYTWQARPTALRVKYHAKVGKVDIALYKDETGNFPLKKGDQDVARIYALIVDWSERPGVTSGTSDPTGCFEPTAITSLAGSGAIIGYASLLIDKSTSGDSMVTVDIPFEFYDKVTNPSNPSDPSKEPAKYSIVISAACSAYGDYMCGYSENVMYVDDFQWVY